MINPEKAREQLEKLKDKSALPKRLRAVNRLGAALKTCGFALLCRRPNGQPFIDWEKRNKSRNEAIQALDAMSPTQRQKLFAALFPKLAGHVEATWQLSQRLPYQMGYDRKAFRAPHDPAVTCSRRENWLNSFFGEVQEYDASIVDAKWIAAWAPYLGYGGADDVGYLLAAVIDQGGAEGDEVFQILKDSAKGEHEIGSMGRHVSRALMVCSRPDAWEFMEKMLLAAQRQEGLRQVILETIDECHPQAFRRMLKLILDENLVRFSSVVRAVDVWLALQWDSVSTRVVTQTLEKLHSFLTDPAARDAVLKKGSGEDVFLALWSLAFDDARTAIEPARRLLRDTGLERRFAAVTLLARLHHPAAIPALREAIEDEDLRIAITAFDALPTFREEEDEVYDANAGSEVQQFALVEKLLARMPDKAPTLKPLIWPWAEVNADLHEVGDKLLACLGKQPLEKLFPYLPRMTSYGRYQVADRLGKLKSWNAQARSLMFDLVNDRDSGVRRVALESLRKAKITPEEGEKLEGILKRKASDTRRAVLTLLLKLPVEAVQQASERLLTAKNPNQRLAGLEMLRLQVESNKRVETCRERARQYRADHPVSTDDETDQLDSILDTERGKYSLDNALGLLDPSQLSVATPPTLRKVRFLTPAAVEVLKSLDALIHEHRDHSFTIQRGEAMETVLLANFGFPPRDLKKPIAEEQKKVPLLEVWQEWYADRPKKSRDADGLELLRADILTEISEWDWNEWQALSKKPAYKPIIREMLGGLDKPPKLKYPNHVSELINWLSWMYPLKGARGWLLDATETAFAMIPEKELNRIPKKDTWQDDWRNFDPFQRWLNKANELEGNWNDAQRSHLWTLLHWHDRPAPGVPRKRPDLHILLDGYRQGVATEADLLDDLLGPRGDSHYWGGRFDSLATLTSRKPHDILSERPEVKTLVDRCRERILLVELKRGDTETPATGPARSLSSLWGLDTLLTLLTRLGKRGFRKSYWGNGKVEVLTHLIAVTFPKFEDTQEAFGEKVKPLIKAGRFTEDRLLELAFLAPQWLKHVAHYLGWEGLEEGAWWYFTHMNQEPNSLDDRDEEDSDDDEEETPKPRKLSAWERLVQERTQLSPEDRRDGAADVAWFLRVYPVLGKKRWQALATAAKQAGSASAAKKAFYLSQVILGKAKKRDIVRDIRVRNLREAVRLLGLLPLASGERREQDLTSRYDVLQGYRRYAKSLGPMSKEGALRTAAIGLENMARTAGYPDPIRFEWAMEAKEIADLAQGPVSHTADGVTVTLTLDAQAAPEVTVMRGDRPLKQVPPKVRKDRKIAALVERKADLRRQASRVRESLERMMCKGDTFTGTELQQLHEHPMLVPLLSRLVLLGEGIAGYPVKNGKGLRGHAGKVEPVKVTETLRIAHPHDLLRSGEWSQWQHECFSAERVQPFKQVFRELYVVTDQEKKDGDLSRRYAGQQVNPTQGQALFGARAWSTREGVEKTFHEAGLVAEVHFRHGGFTPLEVEGWTFESVSFRKRGSWDRVLLKDVPPRIFSEVMRDLDLVVSVAHRGGVDPEASASTVEMRASLLRETCQLLGMNNVRFKDSHVLIEGQLANYSIHLGSAVVHRQPGGHLCIVPVHAQHRGRLFLPFADDDPRTAEVISKTILLARDQEIQDPNLLDQIRASV